PNTKSGLRQRLLRTNPPQSYGSPSTDRGECTAGVGMSNPASHVVRSARLGTGLILFAYSASHFINHALGIRSLSAMEAGSAVLLGPWQTYAGLTALYSSFLLHGGLGLLALLRRRHPRMPPSEAFQLATGLAIPLLLIPHAAGIRL